jgi:hypothetical protein
VGEHLLCKQGVVGSIPSASTSVLTRGAWDARSVDGKFARIGKEEFGH